MTTKEILQKYYDLCRSWDRTFTRLVTLSNMECVLYSDLDGREKQMSAETLTRFGNERLENIQKEFHEFMDTEWEKKE